MRHLREVRLDRVRDDLVAARDVSGARVTPIAARWGFTHMSRFATAYRQKFGEAPSITLRRSTRHRPD
ncbi:helix-turn-helix domain-containing protein [Amycolatopsis sp. NBC_01488]|uniref:helix-turn-helix domain-containing protein n=1 Tax=Amycolatopsis sp. NBC_01488 TaxID=2903563 RepID=UPI003FA4D2F6